MQAADSVTIDPTCGAQLGDTMHLRDAMIDHKGNAYGKGRMFFGPGAEALTLSNSDYVRMGSGRLPRVLALCEAARHPDTGYLVPETVSATVHLPAELALILANALRASKRSTPLTFTLDVGGELLTDPEDYQARLGLSDWRGSVTRIDGVYLVSLSAALRSVQPVPIHVPRNDLPLAEGQLPPRINIEFSVDAITAVVRFGGYSEVLAEKREPEPSRTERTSLGTMRLDTTPIGFSDCLYGVTDDDKWVRFYDGRPDTERTIALGSPHIEHRNESGLMMGIESRFPRIWFRGINLDLIAANMSWSRTFGFRLTSARVGEVEWAPTSADGPGASSKLLDATLEFRLTLDGLVFEYSALPGMRSQTDVGPPGVASPSKSEPRLLGKITLPWEALAIYAPMLMRHREALLKEEDNGS